jgi:chromosome segregation ATPase
VSLLDRAEREREAAVNKLRSAESRAVLASKRAKMHEEEKERWRVRCQELEASKVSPETVHRLQAALKAKTEEHARLERVHTAMLQDVSQGFQEQMEKEREAVQSQVDAMDAEREVMRQQTQLHAQTAEEKEQLTQEVADLYRQVKRMRPASDQLAALRAEHTALQREHAGKVAQCGQVQAELGLMRDELAEALSSVKTLRGDISLLRGERSDAEAAARAATEKATADRTAHRAEMRRKEEAWEKQLRSEQALFVKRVAEHEQFATEKMQRSIDEAKHLHDALNTMRGDLRRYMATPRQPL